MEGTELEWLRPTETAFQSATMWKRPDQTTERHMEVATYASGLNSFIRRSESVARTVLIRQPSGNLPWLRYLLAEGSVSHGHVDDTKERVRSATDIVDLVREYVPTLRRQGSQFVCHCPWHDDNRPSLQINPSRQSWVCWVCNIRGDVFDFVMRRENVEFFEALRILAERAGIPLTLRQKRIEKGSVDDKQTLYRAMAWAESQYHRYLTSHENAAVARSYLADRSINQESIDEFKIGFAPTSFTWLIDRLGDTDFSPEILEACGLASRNRMGGWYERFRGRLIFPIRDTMQRPIALGGRLVPGVFSPDQEPPGKYVNSPETRLFAKSETLYGLNLVRDQVARDRKLAIVEGYTDVVGAYQAGMRNVVACLGTALNDRHICLIQRFADQITLVLDGDEAGRKRANEILDLFVANDVDLRILTLPENADPFDFVFQNGAEAFQNLIDGAADAIDHKIRIETSGIDLINETHRANAALENILSTIARIPTSVFSGSAAKVLRQDQLLSRLARQFSVDREQIKRRLAELRNRLSRVSQPAAQPVTPEMDPSQFDRRESELVQLVIQDPELLDYAVENISPDQFVEGPLRLIYEEICYCFHEGRDASYDDLMLIIEDPRQKDLLVFLDQEWQNKKEFAASNSQSIGANRDLLDTLILRFHEMEEETGNRRRISALQQKQLDTKEEVQTLEELLNQTRQRQGLTPPTEG